MWGQRWRTRREARIGDELRSHRDRLIEDYIVAGMDRSEAERRAFLEFGNVGAIEEEVRDVRGRWLDDFAKDLTYALRTLLRSPGFSLVAILSFALGIGANAAIFSVINGVMLRTLPVHEPERLVQIARLLSGRPGQVSYPVFELFRDNIRSISNAFAQQSTTLTAVIEGNEETVAADLVSGSYFTVLRIDAAAGRLLGPADDVLSPASPAAVISDRYWQRRFGRSPSAIGTSLTVHDRVFTIVGVTPDLYNGARAGSPPDLMLPLLTMLSDLARTQAGFNSLTLLARLNPGATVEQARAEAEVLYRPIAQAQADEAPGAAERAALRRQQIVAFHAPDGFNPVRDDIKEPLLILMGTVGLILMLACVNVSGLLLARASSRQRELSIRLAIGAGRGRLVRQFLTESLVLAVLGAVAGFAIAGRLSERLFALFINGRPIDLPVALDVRVLAFTAGVCVAACVAAGLVPALHAFRVRVSPELKEVTARGTGRLGKSLVVAQLAISMVLVVGATLFIGTLINLYSVDRGFDSDGVLVVQVRSSRPYPLERVRAVEAALLDGLRTLPEVRSASAGQVLPIGGGFWDRNVRVEGHASETGEPENVAFNAIAPGYFTTLGTPLVAGREFDVRDLPTSPFVAIVNDSFARSFFGSESAIGRHVTSVGITYEIVGVVRDAKYHNLREAIPRTLYVAWMQGEVEQPSRYSYLVRVEGGDPLRLSSAVERVVREVDSALRLAPLSSYSTLIDRSIPSERLMATVGGLFGLLALLLAAVGMFGVLAFQVARRTNELGVRTALGASRRSLVSLVLKDVTGMVVPGIVIGGGVALTLTGFAQQLLFGVMPTDPGVFLVAASALAGAALLAGWVPARRASTVDPLVALRHE